MTVDPSPAEELAGVFARMSGVLLSEATVATALATVTSLAVDTIARNAIAYDTFVIQLPSWDLYEDYELTQTGDLEMTPGGPTFEPIDATIHDLVRLPRPLEPRERRRTEAEFRVYRVRAVLEAVRPRIDQDFHLLLRDPEDPEARMIVEIPNPRCALESRHVAAFAAVRHVAESLQKTHGTLVEVVGPGFFDMPETRIGGAPNGFELHPVLELTEIRGANSSGMPGHSPDEALIANRTSLSPTSRPAIAPIQGFRISRRNAALQANLLAKRRRHAAE